MQLPTNVSSLHLKSLGGHHAEEVYELIQHNRQHLTRYGDYEDLVIKDLDSIRLDIANTPSHESAFGLLLETQMIGTVSLIKYEEYVFGLGYWRAENYSGHGYMTEAVRTLVDFSISSQGATELWAGIKPGNIPSINLAKRLGFRLAREQPSHVSYKLTISQQTYHI